VSVSQNGCKSVCELLVDARAAGGGAPAGRRSGVTTTEHAEPPPGSLQEMEAQAAAAASRLAEGENPDAAQLPPGTVQFNLGQEQLSGERAQIF